MLFLISLACKSNINEEDFERLDLFCDTPEEAFFGEYVQGETQNGSGKLHAQLMSDADYPRDLTYIAKATYILENLDVGGGEDEGQANAIGTIDTIRGEGNWFMRIEGPTGCLGEVSFEIIAEQTLNICVPLTCEE